MLVCSNPSNEQDPIAFQPVECDFSGAGVNFKTFDFKWGGNIKNPWKTVEDPQLITRYSLISNGGVVGSR